MASPYTSVTVSGYNANPPADDGSTVESNRVKWATIKEKLPDPLKTALESINTNVAAAFAKVLGGAGVTSTAISYQVLSADQGKLVVGTGAGITITTPSATDVDDPFWFIYVNASSGTQTLDGSGSQTINGAANLTIPIGGGVIVATDGSNWFAAGMQGVQQGRQLMYGDIINGTITESNGSNAVTYALKTLAGNDPSADDPVIACFRNATAGTGNYVFRAITAALALTIPSTATMGAVNAVAFDIVLALFDDAGTIRLGAINPFLSGTQYYDLTQIPPIASSTTVGAGSDSAKVWYTGTGVTSKPYLIIAICKYTSGLVTAGTWNVSPTPIQPFGHGVTLPSVAKKSDVGWQLIYTQDASASATIDFDTVNAAAAFDGTFDQIEIRISNMKPQTDDTNLHIRIGTGAGPTYATASYMYAGDGEAPGGALDLGSTSAAAILTMHASHRLGSAAGEHLSGTVTFCDPEAANLQLAKWDFGYVSLNGQPISMRGSGMNGAAAAMTGIRFLMSSGNITSGTFAIYGLKKSAP